MTSEDFRSLAINAVQTFGQQSPKTGTWRLFRQPLIISFYPNRGNQETGSLLVLNNIEHPAAVVWCGVTDTPSKPLEETYQTIKGWFEEMS